MNLDQIAIRVPIGATAGVLLGSYNVTGYFVAVVEAVTEVDLSIDGGPKVRFGPGREIAPRDADGRPVSFSNLSFYVPNPAADAPAGFTVVPPLVAVNDGVVRVVYGSLAGFDRRVALLPGDFIRHTVAGGFQGSDIAIANDGLPHSLSVYPIATAPYSPDFTPYTRTLMLWKIRNIGTVAVRIASARAAGFPAPAAGGLESASASGWLLNPGEADDIPCRTLLYARVVPGSGAAGLLNVAQLDLAVNF
ncbi:MAG: hypothetical protein RLZZ15_703 [Verrucomicrobiota bacterium]